MPATFLVLAFGELGHSLPMLGIVEALVRRGHLALVYTSEHLQYGVAAAGGEYLAPRTFEDPFALMRRRMEERRKRKSQAPRLRGFVRRLREARDEMVEGVVRISWELEDVIRTRKVDCVVSCITVPGAQFVPGARFAAERTGCAYASVGPSPMMLFSERGGLLMRPRSMLRHVPDWAVHSLLDAVIPVRRCRERLELPAGEGGPSETFRATVSDALHLVTAHEGFVPLGPRRSGQVCVGPLSFDLPRPGTAPFPVETLAPGTVLVSATSFPGLDGGLFRRTLEALAPLKVPLLATAVGATDLPENLGEHVRLEPYVPHDQVLPHVAALVAPAGWGITGRALRQGIPMLVTSLPGDQPLIGARLEELGLAYHLPRKRATKESIRNALVALLGDTALRQRVKAVAAKLKEVDSPRLAAEALEKLLA
jgi:UDP:flavonoid glycosyltransferase YjiC (YdhE family)